MKPSNIVFAGAMALALSNAQAELFDRGGGLIYDDVLNVTWLADANYAMTSGYDADGLMNWSAATTWAANLSFNDSVRNVTYTDWRLASNTPVGAGWDYSDTFNGSTDRGYNITSPHSELSYMYYVNLGFKGYYSPTGAVQGGHGIFGDNSASGERDGLGPNGEIVNLQSYVYWSAATDDARNTTNPWTFITFIGYQYPYPYDANAYDAYAWAVRDGDVASVAAPIPEPSTYAMLLAGLGLLGLAAKRRRQKLSA